MSANYFVNYFFAITFLISSMGSLASASAVLSCNVDFKCPSPLETCNAGLCRCLDGFSRDPSGVCVKSSEFSIFLIMLAMAAALAIIALAVGYCFRLCSGGQSSTEKLAVFRSEKSYGGIPYSHLVTVDSKYPTKAKISLIGAQRV